MTPKVTVCVPTYNYARYLPACVGSVLAQSLADWELIVVDDVSSDSTDEVMAAYRDERIRYLKNETNLGLVRNVNRTLSLARGEYVVVLHADDLLAPEMLRTGAEFLDRHPNVGHLHSSFDLVDGDGRRLESKGRPWPTGAVAGRVELEHLLLDNDVGLPTVMARQRCYAELGGYDESYEWVHDWEMWMRWALHHDVGFVQAPLAATRAHGSNVTVTKFFAQPNLALDEERRLLEAMLSQVEDPATRRRLTTVALGRMTARQVGRAYRLLRGGHGAAFRRAIAGALAVERRLFARFPVLLPLWAGSMVAPGLVARAMRLRG